MNSLFAVTLQALAPLFGLIALGYLLKRVRVLHVAHAPVLNGLVVNATLPALVLHSLLHAPAIPPRDVLLPFLLIAAEVVLVILVAVAARALRWPPPLAAAAILVASFGNSGFLGYPITLALMPSQFSGAVLLDQFGMSIGLYIAAPLVASLYCGIKETEPQAQPVAESRVPVAILGPQGRAPSAQQGTGTGASTSTAIRIDHPSESDTGLSPSPSPLTGRASAFVPKIDFAQTVGRVLRAPMLIAAILAIVLRQITVPHAVAAMPAIAALAHVIDACLTYLGQGTVPLILLALGVTLRPGDVARSVRPLILTCAVKLLVCPLIMWMLCRWAHIPAAQTALAVMIGAMPTAVMASVLSGQYDLDDGFAVATVFVTTLLSIVTIPLWLTIVT